jgi:hypothetical protein
MMNTTGWYEAQDVNGKWHKVTDFQAAALRLDGVKVRYQTEGMKICAAVAQSINK